MAPEKTRTLRFSRFHPTMRRRFTFLGFEFFWKEDRERFKTDCHYRVIQRCLQQRYRIYHVERKADDRQFGYCSCRDMKL